MLSMAEIGVRLPQGPTTGQEAPNQKTVPASSRPKKLIVVKLDQIGDYVLFRNFLGIIRNSPKYEDHELTFLGNIECRELAESQDRGVVHRFLWLDKQRYASWKYYRKWFHARLRGLRFDVLISPLYSRENGWTEPVVEAINAQEKIGSAGDLSNITAVHRCVANANYDQLLPACKDVLFEFLRNKEFFERLLEQDIEIEKPRLNPSLVSPRVTGRYAVLFPGAKGKYRRWSEVHFAELADYLSKRHQLRCLVCGSRQDKTLARKVQGLANTREVVNMCGAVSLSDLPSLFHNAQLVLTNDTSAHHIAAAVGAKTVCLSNGNTLGRFVPYPGGMADSIRYAYPLEVERELHDFEAAVEKFKYASRIDINGITPDTVKKLVDELL